MTRVMLSFRFGLIGIVAIATAIVSACTRPAPGPDITDSITKGVRNSHRSEANVARDAFRHPAETLAFFGLEEDMTVIEALPGGLWYGEIVAPILRDRGQYVAAAYDISLPDSPEYQTRGYARMVERFEDEPEIFGTPKIVMLSAPDSINLGEPGSADMVLTFRNTHGWVRDDTAEPVYAAFFEVLKSRGILGVVQHRAGTETDTAPGTFTGYVAEDRVIELATAAGFILEARSEINANPKDKANYAKGVWTLPPTLTLKDQDRDQYLAIGESDRMTLRFRKP
jgi:predicted methyltransferase